MKPVSRPLADPLLTEQVRRLISGFSASQVLALRDCAANGELQRVFTGWSGPAEKCSGRRWHQPGTIEALARRGLVTLRDPHLRRGARAELTPLGRVYAGLLPPKEP